ncbi:MAG TPA: hypothetical protein VFI40_04905 [Nocardioides sp.]|nr:hypothetical protein [Nocardioides sp.]
MALANLVVVAPAPTAAHTTGSPHYYGNCDQGSGSWLTIGFTYVGGQFDQVSAFANVEHLWPCQDNGNVTAANSGLSLVNAVNLQFADDHVIQLGYGSIACPSGFQACNDMGSESFAPGYAMQFWYTKLGDLQDPVIYGATWVDFDHDGWTDYPALDETYSFRIAWFSDNTWEYKVCGVTGQYAGLCSSIRQTAHHTYGTEAWWGFESHNQASAFGTPMYNNALKIWNQGYSTTNSGTVTIRTAASCHWAWDAPIPGQNCYTGTDSGSGSAYIRAAEGSHS